MNAPKGSVEENHSAMRNLNLFNMTLRSPVTEEFLAFSAEKTADDGLPLER
jgi:hypothetical protein